MKMKHTLVAEYSCQIALMIQHPRFYQFCIMEYKNTDKLTDILSEKSD